MFRIYFSLCKFHLSWSQLNAPLLEFPRNERLNYLHIYCLLFFICQKLDHSAKILMFTIPKKTLRCYWSNFPIFFLPKFAILFYGFGELGVLWKCVVEMSCFKFKTSTLTTSPSKLILMHSGQVKSGRVGSIHVDNLFIARNSLMCIVHIVELCSF